MFHTPLYQLKGQNHRGGKHPPPIFNRQNSPIGIGLNPTLSGVYCTERYVIVYVKCMYGICTLYTIQCVEHAKSMFN